MDRHGDEVHVWYGHGDDAGAPHAFLRRVLARYTGTAPEDLEPERAPCRRCGEAHGKPFLAGHPDVTLSPFLGIRKDRRADRTIISSINSSQSPIERMQ